MARQKKKKLHSKKNHPPRELSPAAQVLGGPLTGSRADPDAAVSPPAFRVPSPPTPGVVQYPFGTASFQT